MLPSCDVYLATYKNKLNASDCIYAIFYLKRFFVFSVVTPIIACIYLKRAYCMSLLIVH